MLSSRTTHGLDRIAQSTVSLGLPSTPLTELTTGYRWGFPPAPFEQPLSCIFLEGGLVLYSVCGPSCGEIVFPGPARRLHNTQEGHSVLVQTMDHRAGPAGASLPSSLRPSRPNRSVSSRR